ncbi:hypothetical protein GCM10028832_04550 [Streptomyces sparsus]
MQADPERQGFPGLPREGGEVALGYVNVWTNGSVTIDYRNTTVKPFTWTATAGEVLAKARIVATNVRKLVNNIADRHGQDHGAPGNVRPSLRRPERTGPSPGSPFPYRSGKAFLHYFPRECFSRSTGALETVDWLEQSCLRAMTRVGCYS